MILRKIGACALCCVRLAEMFFEATEQVRIGWGRRGRQAKQRMVLRTIGAWVLCFVRLVDMLFRVQNKQEIGGGGVFLPCTAVVCRAVSHPFNFWDGARRVSPTRQKLLGTRGGGREANAPLY